QILGFSMSDIIKQIKSQLLKAFISFSRRVRWAVVFGWEKGKMQKINSPRPQAYLRVCVVGVLCVCVSVCVVLCVCVCVCVVVCVLCRLHICTCVFQCVVCAIKNLC